MEYMTLDQILYHSGKEARQDFTEGSPDEGEYSSK